MDQDERDKIERRLVEAIENKGMSAETEQIINEIPVLADLLMYTISTQPIDDETRALLMNQAERYTEAVSHFVDDLWESILEIEAGRQRARLAEMTGQEPS